MEKEWCYSPDGIEIQNVDINFLKNLEKEGFPPQSKVWKTGLIRWVPANQYEEIEKFLDAKNVQDIQRNVTEEEDQIFLKKLREILTSKEAYLSNIWYIVFRGIPLVGSILSKGFRLEIIRSQYTITSIDRRKVGHYLSEGMFLWSMYLFYMFIQFLLIAFFGNSWLDGLIEIFGWLISTLFFGGATETFSEVLRSQTIGFILQTAIFQLYPILIWPFYRAAVLRYALQGRKLVFVEFYSNILLVFQRRKTFLNLFIKDRLANFIIFGVSFLLIVLIPPLSFVSLGISLSVFGLVKDFVLGRLHQQIYRYISPKMVDYFPGDGEQQAYINSL